MCCLLVNNEHFVSPWYYLIYVLCFAFVFEYICCLRHALSLSFIFLTVHLANVKLGFQFQATDGFLTLIKLYCQTLHIRLKLVRNNRKIIAMFIKCKNKIRNKCFSID